MKKNMRIIYNSMVKILKPLENLTESVFLVRNIRGEELKFLYRLVSYSFDICEETLMI